MTSSTGPVYEALYGHTPRHIFVVGFGLVISALILLVPAPAYARAVVVAGFGGAAVMMAVMALSRVAAIRVDAEGVTVRPYPLRFKVIAFYPWEDVVQIRIVRREDLRTPYVVIKLRDGAWLSMINRLTRPKSRKALFFALPPGVDVNQWTLRPARLAAAVACFAPTVQVVEATTDLVINIDRPVPPDYLGQYPRQQLPLAHGWPGWVLAGAAAGLVAGIVLAVVNGNTADAASTAAGLLILLAVAALCVAVTAALCRRFRSRRRNGGAPLSPEIGGVGGEAEPTEG